MTDLDQFILFHPVLFILCWIVCFICIWLLCREIVCWYYKLNKIVKNQEEIIKLLRVIAQKEKEENK